MTEKLLHVCWLTLNVAVTVLAAVMLTVQEFPEEVAHPLQPLNVEPLAAWAVSTTGVPDGYGSEQSPPQLTPAGLLVTVPLPAPFFVTVSVWLTVGAWIITETEVEEHRL